VKCVPFCEHRVKLTNLPEEINKETLERLVQSCIGPHGNIEFIYIDNQNRIAILHLNSKETKDLFLKKGNLIVVSKSHQKLQYILVRYYIHYLSL
jgi:hypothetical protein